MNDVGPSRVSAQPARRHPRLDRAVLARRQGTASAANATISLEAMRPRTCGSVPRHVPQARGGIQAPGQQQRTIWRKGGLEDDLRVTGERVERLTGGHLPDPGRLVVRAGRDEPSIGREDGVRDVSLVAGELADLTAAVQVPQGSCRAGGLNAMRPSGARAGALSSGIGPGSGRDHPRHRAAWDHPAAAERNDYPARRSCPVARRRRRSTARSRTRHPTGESPCRSSRQAFRRERSRRRGRSRPGPGASGCRRGPGRRRTSCRHRNPRAGSVRPPRRRIRLPAAAR
jgi:hypothetical protein